VEQLKDVSLRHTPALPATIKLGWRSLPGTNTLAYYKKGNYRQKLTPAGIMGPGYIKQLFANKLNC
jgi:hypothetical protein